MKSDTKSLASLLEQIFGGEAGKCGNPNCPRCHPESDAFDGSPSAASLRRFQSMAKLGLDVSILKIEDDQHSILNDAIRAIQEDSTINIEKLDQAIARVGDLGYPKAAESFVKLKEFVIDIRSMIPALNLEVDEQLAAYRAHQAEREQAERPQEAQQEPTTAAAN